MIWSDSMYYEDGMAWFYAMNCNGLFCWDVEAGEFTYLDSIPNLPSRIFRKYSRTVKMGEVLILLPDTANNIATYDLEKKKVQLYPLERTGERFLVQNYFVQDDTIFFLSKTEKAMFEFHKDKPTNVKRYNIVTGYNEEIGEEAVRVGDNIYIPCSNRNSVYEFNIVTKQVIEHVVAGVEGGFCTICHDGEFFWLTGICKKIVRWNMVEKENIEIVEIPVQYEQYWFDVANKRFSREDYPGDIANRIAPFFKSYSSEDYIWLVPYYSETIVYVEKKSNIVKVLEIDGEEENLESQLVEGRYLQQKYILEFKTDNDIMMLYSCKTNLMYELNCRNATYKKKNFQLNRQGSAQWMETVFKQYKDVVMEDRIFNIVGYIDYLVQI